MTNKETITIKLDDDVATQLDQDVQYKLQVMDEIANTIIDYIKTKRL